MAVVPSPQRGGTVFGSRTIVAVDEAVSARFVWNNPRTAEGADRAVPLRALQNGLSGVQERTGVDMGWMEIERRASASRATGGQGNVIGGNPGGPQSDFLPRVSHPIRMRVRKASQRFVSLKAFSTEEANQRFRQGCLAQSNG